jgi:hypothetical protein
MCFKNRLLYLLMFCLSCFIYTGCSSDDDPVDEEEMFEEDEDVDELNYLSVASVLLDGEKISEDSLVYTFSYGEVLDSSTPTVRSMGMNSYEEAFDWFVYHCVPVDQRENYTGLMGEITIDMGEYGTITYHPSESADLYASIDIHLKDISNVTRLDIIPMSLWPNNETSDYVLGDVVYDTQGVEGVKEYYLCVSECEGSHKGILLSFSPAWEDKFIDTWNEQGVSIHTPVGTTEDAWQALAHYVYGDEVKFKNRIEDVESKFPGVQFTKTRACNVIMRYPDNAGTLVVFGYASCKKYNYLNKKLKRIKFRNIWQRCTWMDYVIDNGIPKYETAQCDYSWYNWATDTRTHTRHYHSETFSVTPKGQTKRFTRIYPKSGK